MRTISAITTTSRTSAAGLPKPRTGSPAAPRAFTPSRRAPTAASGSRASDVRKVQKRPTAGPAFVPPAVEESLRVLASWPQDHPRRAALRAEVLERLLPLAGRVAQRFRDRGEPLDDLVQVARLALIKAVDGYDPDRGTGFSGYAVPTIAGELKRHFRDKGWGMRVPRALQERHLGIARATDELTQTLGRIPTHADLARHLGLTEAEVREGQSCGQAYAPLSLYLPAGDGSSSWIADLLGGPDPGIELIEYRESLRPLIARLPGRQQRILALRFEDNMTQSQIATHVHLSQMHVSRLLNQSLSQLRTWLTA